MGNNTQTPAAAAAEKVAKEAEKQAAKEVAEAAEKAAKEAEKQAAKEAKEKTSARTSRVKGLFKQFPAAQELHFTSDGFAFLSQCDAKNHARSLDSKEVEIVKRTA
jgi:membrane protein involved in colicin uptake